MLEWYRRLRREHLLAEPYPEEWEAHIVRNVAHYRGLTAEERQGLRKGIRILIAEKTWEGCNGLEITEEMKVTIAAQASLMLLAKEHDFFSRTVSILVYPTAFAIPDENFPDDKSQSVGIVGQAVYRGPVILAWDEVLEEGRDPSLGQNVVIHEFAHQLDFLDGSSNGTPDLESAEQAQRWREVMSQEFAKLRHDIENRHHTFLGKYAATNEAEFFAVASEKYFTQPTRLRHFHPSMHQALADYYQVDPAKWLSGART